jgi:hypothetical protein
MTTAGVLRTACANCGKALDRPFCSQCGQKAAPLNPSVGEFLHDVLHEVTHLDGKIPQSVRLLLTRPGFLTQEQFEGTTLLRAIASSVAIGVTYSIAMVAALLTILFPVVLRR